MVDTTTGAVLRARPVWMVVIGVTVACAVFVGLLAAAWWNPPSRTGNVKVALVNEDAGFVVPAGPTAGQKLLLGSKVAKTIQDVKVEGEILFDWQTVGSRQAALQGLRDGDCVLAIVIPKDFSARMATLTSIASGATASSGSAGPSTAGETAIGGSPAAVEIEIIPNQANAAYEMSLVTSMAQQLVQRASTMASAGLVQKMQATPSEIAVSISEPIKATVAPINPVDRYGKSIGLVFFMLFMAIGGLALTVAAHLATRGQRRSQRFPVGLVLGRWLGLLLPAIVLAVACTACIQLFGFSMESAATTYGIMMLGMVAFMTFNLMLGAVFGVVGLPIAGLLIPLQVAAGGAMMGPELTPGFYQAVSTVIPYTYTLTGLRQGMFAGGGAGPAAAALVAIIGACLVVALAFCFIPGLFRRHASLTAPGAPSDSPSRLPRSALLAVPATVPDRIVAGSPTGEGASEQHSFSD
jgi:YhgE/Pip-like protein